MGPSGPFLFPLWKPAIEKVREILESLRDDNFSYDADLVGTTRGGVDAVEPLRKKRFQIDHNQVCIGSGEAAFQRAKKAVRDWRHFQLGWATVDPDTPIRERERVAVVARSFGLVWTLNPLQILYVDDGTDSPSTSSTREESSTNEKRNGGSRSGGRKARAKVGPGAVEREEGLSGGVSTKARFAYGHGTLKGHLLSGEERFLVEWRDDDSVWYDILAFSRPGHFLAAATYPAARFYQRQFAKQSMRAVQAAVEEDPD